MFDHPIIDIALGLIFFYVVLSLVASAVQEWIASLFALRSKNLSQGIERLLGDAYAKKIYAHPLIKNLARENRKPSYIAPETLSTVLLEVIATEGEGKSFLSRDYHEVRDVVAKVDQNNPLRVVLEALVSEGENALGDLQDKLAGWFDEGMTRISGWYKRQVKVLIFCIAAGVTVVTNASTIHLSEELWKNDALRAQIAMRAEAAASQPNPEELRAANLKNLETLPIGWDKDKIPGDIMDWLKTLVGWLITIAAISLGAPFWFDLLGKVANLKGSGGKAQARKA